MSRLLEGHIPKIARRTVGDVRLPFRSSYALAGADVLKHSSVLNLHNLHGNFFDFRALPILSAVKPLVWTLHDMWAATGHCAYSYACDRWRRGCGHCPLFASELRHFDEIPQAPFDTTAWSWRAKRDTYRETPLALVAPSRWLMNIAEESILLSHPRSFVRHIPYGLDIEEYRPIDRAKARSLLRVPINSPLLLFAAASVDQPRKGMQHFLEALERVRREIPDLQIMTFGQWRGPVDGRVHSLGPCSNASLQAVIYSAADLFVAPSLADNQPLQVLESLACGLPTVAYGVGGVGEVVRHLSTGYCAAPADIGDLTEGIRLLLADDDLRHKLGNKGRQLICAEHSLERQASRYTDLYEELIEQRERDHHVSA